MKSMALIKCYECGKEISDKAPSCPHCGAPKLVAANKEVKTKKSLALSKYLKPIGIGLGIILIPLAAVASVPLIQANGNIDAVVWRFKNKKFIKERCYWNDFEKKPPTSKKCRSLLYKLRRHVLCIGFFLFWQVFPILFVFLSSYFLVLCIPCNLEYLLLCLTPNSTGGVFLKSFQLFLLIYKELSCIFFVKVTFPRKWVWDLYSHQSHTHNIFLV